MFAIQVASMLVVLIGIILPYLLVCKRRGKVVSNKLYKTFALILAVVFYFRFMLGDEPLRYVFKLSGDRMVINKFYTAVSLILNWLQYAAVFGIILY